MSGIKRKHEIPVLCQNSKMAISNIDKAEMIAQVLVKIQSSDNLSGEAKQERNNILDLNPHVAIKRIMLGDNTDLPFNMFELKKAFLNARQTSPGKYNICYTMLAHMEDNSLAEVLRLFNRVWETGKIPIAWKQSVIVPILKPGKDPSDPSNYRPIALTSQLGKTMERMVTERLAYVLESKGLLSPYQSGFRKGRNTMDSILCLESEIRKAQTNKEMVVTVFLDIEKAYDMLRKEGLLIKLNKLGMGVDYTIGY